MPWVKKLHSISMRPGECRVGREEREGPHNVAPKHLPAVPDGDSYLPLLTHFPAIVVWGELGNQREGLSFPL